MLSIIEKHLYFTCISGTPTEILPLVEAVPKTERKDKEEQKGTIIF